MQLSKFSFSNGWIRYLKKEKWYPQSLQERLAKVKASLHHPYGAVLTVVPTSEYPILWGVLLLPRWLQINGKPRLIEMLPCSFYY